MNDLEERLRDAFTAAAGTVRPETLRPAPERKPERRAGRALLLLAAAVSVAAVIAAIAVIVPLVFSGSHRPGGGPAASSSPSPSSTRSRPTPSASAAPTVSRTSPPLPGAPRFIADLPVTSNTDGPLQIRDSATGKVVATDPNVRGTALAALSGGRAFLIASPAPGNACATNLYRFTISATGQPGPLTPLPVPALTGGVASLAASANGHIVAYADMGRGKESTTYLGVVNITTGKITKWGGVNVMGNGTGQSQSLAGELSITADGHLLAYETATFGANRATTVYVLPTGAPAGTAAQRSRAVARFPTSPRSALAGAVISPGGRILDACTTAGGKLPSLTVAAYAVATGHRLNTVATLRGTSACGPLDPSGRFLLVSGTYPGTGAPGQAVFGDAEVAVATGRVARITVTTPSGAMSSIVSAMLLAW